MAWTWEWIRAKHEAGVSPREIEKLCREQFGEGPSFATIWRRATSGDWGASKPRPSKKKEQPVVDVAPEDITHAQYVEAAKEILIVSQHSAELQDARRRLRSLLVTLESFLPSVEPPEHLRDDVEPPEEFKHMDDEAREKAYDAWSAARREELRTWEASRNAQYRAHLLTLKVYVESLVKVIALERQVHKLDEPGAERRDEIERELNEGAVVAAYRDIEFRDEHGEAVASLELDTVHAVHLPELPAGAVPLSDGGGDEAIDVDADDQAPDSVYTTETW